MIVFYSGIRAEIVSAKESNILQHFPDYQRVAAYTYTDIRHIMIDHGMIKHKGKIQLALAMPASLPRSLYSTDRFRIGWTHTMRPVAGRISYDW